MNTMSGQDSVQGRPPIEAERKAAEHEYITTAFNYPEAPVGSRDWTLYWAGWLARSTHALASSVAKPETQEPAPFDVMIDGYYAQLRIEQELSDILGVELLGISYDYYDSSIEIFPGEDVADVTVSEEQHAAILALGCERYWINFPDSTERYGRGDRTAKDYCRWKQFNNGEAQQRRRERIAASPSTGAAEGAIPTEDGIRWQSGNTWPNERKAVTVDGRTWYRDDHHALKNVEAKHG